jgi:metal-responsive CopG/Arc/MetJ family transcriptional regulator
MPRINFDVSNVLDHKIDVIRKKQGFSSQAELFRFALIKYFDELENGCGCSSGGSGSGSVKNKKHMPPERGLA